LLRDAKRYARAALRIARARYDSQARLPRSVMPRKEKTPLIIMRDIARVRDARSRTPTAKRLLCCVFKRDAFIYCARACASATFRDETSCCALQRAPRCCYVEEAAMRCPTIQHLSRHHAKRCGAWSSALMARFMRASYDTLIDVATFAALMARRHATMFSACHRLIISSMPPVDVFVLSAQPR